jgi:DNA-binding transcriptional LysR family regulator
MLDDVEFRDLRIFLALADELHFGRTAERLGMAQSAVSQAIRLLERRLGTKLFERNSRRVQLTPAGADLQKNLTPLIESLGRVLTDVQDESNGVTGVLRLGPTLTTALLPPVYLLSRLVTRAASCTFAR